MQAPDEEDEHKWYRVMMAALFSQRSSRLGAGWCDNALELVQRGAQLTQVNDEIFRLLDALDPPNCDLVIAHALPAHILTSEDLILRAVRAIRPFVFESMIAQGVRFRDDNLILLRAVQLPRIMMALQEWNHYSNTALETKAIETVQSHNLRLLYYLIGRHPFLTEDPSILDKLVTKSITVNNFPIFRYLIQFITSTIASIFTRTRHRAKFFEYVISLLPNAVPEFIEMQICERGDIDAMSVLARKYPHLVTHQLLHFAKVCSQPIMAELLEHILRERGEEVQCPDQTALAQVKAVRQEKVLAECGPDILKVYSSPACFTPSDIPYIVKLATVRDDTELLIYLMDKFPEPFQLIPFRLLNILTPSRLIEVLNHYLRRFTHKKAHLQAICLPRWPRDAALELFLLQNEVIIGKKMIELAQRTRDAQVFEFILDNYSGDDDIVSARFVRKTIECNKVHVFRVLLQRGLVHHPTLSTISAIQSGAAAVLLVLLTEPNLLAKKDIPDIMGEIAKTNQSTLLEIVLSQRSEDLTNALLLKAGTVACIYGNAAIAERLADTLVSNHRGRDMRHISYQLTSAAARAGRREILMMLIRKYGWHADEYDIAVGRAKGLIA